MIFFVNNYDEVNIREAIWRYKLNISVYIKRTKRNGRGGKGIKKQILKISGFATEKINCVIQLSLVLKSCKINTYVK